jgi:fermentation-respiration switch protein FrsA (DUF1100 family)
MGWPGPQRPGRMDRMIARRQPGARIVAVRRIDGCRHGHDGLGRERDLAPGSRLRGRGLRIHLGLPGVRAPRPADVPYIPTLPILLPASLACLVRCGWSIIGASAVRQIRRHRPPMMFIHGQEDDYVPFGMVHRLYGAARGPRSSARPGAGHGLSSSVDPQLLGQGVHVYRPACAGRMPAA